MYKKKKREETKRTRLPLILGVASTTRPLSKKRSYNGFVPPPIPFLSALCTANDACHSAASNERHCPPSRGRAHQRTNPRACRAARTKTSGVRPRACTKRARRTRASLFCSRNGGGGVIRSRVTQKPHLQVDQKENERKEKAVKYVRAFLFFGTTGIRTFRFAHPSLAIGLRA